MKGILLLNGEPYRGKIDCSDALAVCCDGAYNWARKKVRPDKNVGDFDSVRFKPRPAPEEVFPAEKDMTDGEIGIKKLLSAGCKSVEIYGGGGGRTDHFLGNLHLMKIAFDSGVPCTMHLNGGLAYLAGGKILLGKFCGKTVSVLPFGAPLHIMDSKGLKYAYPEYIPYGSTRGISNIVENEAAYLKTENCALIIVNDKV